jgi:hypothetical protein
MLEDNIDKEGVREILAGAKIFILDLSEDENIEIIRKLLKVKELS